MADIRLDSQGFTIGRWYFPPFVLRSGECFSLQMPKGASADEDRIVSCLTGVKPVPGLKLHSKVLVAQRALNPFGWRRWFQDPSAFAWLKRNTTFSDDVINTILLEHHIARRSWPGTEGAILGLIAAFSNKPGAVIFSTSGLDPRGVRETFRVVDKNLPECSVIYLAWPFLCQEQECHDSFPGSVDITVCDVLQPTLAE